MAEPGTISFYQSKIQFNMLRIEQVEKIIKQAKRLNSDIYFQEVSYAIGQLDLVITKLGAENKRCKELIEEIKADHRQRHVELHNILRQVAQSFSSNTRKNQNEISVRDFMEWLAYQKERNDINRAIDELIADFIAHTDKLPSTSSISDLMQWSYKQTIEPTE